MHSSERRESKNRTGERCLLVRGRRDRFMLRVPQLVAAKRLHKWLTVKIQTPTALTAVARTDTICTTAHAGKDGTFHFHRNYHKQSVSMRPKRQALPRASHYGEIALAGSRRMHSTLSATPVPSAHAIVTIAKNKQFRQPQQHSGTPVGMT